MDGESGQEKGPVKRRRVRSKSSTKKALTIASGVLGAAALGDGVPRAQEQAASSPLMYGADSEWAGVEEGEVEGEVDLARRNVLKLHEAYHRAAEKLTQEMEGRDFYKQYQEPMYNFSRAYGTRMREYEFAQDKTGKERKHHTYPIESLLATHAFEEQMFKYLDEERREPSDSVYEREKRILRKQRLLDTYITQAIELDIYKSKARLSAVHHTQATSLASARITGFYCGYFDFCPPLNPLN